MDTLKKLQELFKRFPGIGERQAMRFAYFLATADRGYIDTLTETIEALKMNVKRCGRCFALSEKIVNGMCIVCADPKTNKEQLLVIEKDADRERFIKSRTYNGTYFVLGGLAPAIEKDFASHIRTRELLTLISKEMNQGLSEVILALSATPDGERTNALLKVELGKISEDTLKVSILGKGLSTGTEIEYSDADTLLNALQSRR
ncbi:MAG: toprim domain-containing protein [bacterium]